MTEEEKKELVQDVVNQIKTASQSVDELEAVSTLDGVVSLPAMSRIIDHPEAIETITYPLE